MHLYAVHSPSLLCCSLSFALAPLSRGLFGLQSRFTIVSDAGSGPPVSLALVDAALPRSRAARLNAD
jgi:hypothetical protein